MPKKGYDQLDDRLSASFSVGYTQGWRALRFALQDRGIEIPPELHHAAEERITRELTLIREVWQKP